MKSSVGVSTELLEGKLELRMMNEMEMRWILLFQRGMISVHDGRRPCYPGLKSLTTGWKRAQEGSCEERNLTHLIRCIRNTNVEIR